MERLKKGSRLVWMGGLLTAILIATAVGAFFDNALLIFRGGVLLVAMFFLPGWAASYLIEPRETNPAFRIVLALAISLAIEPTVFFLVSFLGVSISLVSAAATALTLTLIFFAVTVRKTTRH